MPKIRISVRGTMLAVAIVGVLLWAGIMWRRSIAYHAIAAQHASMERYLSLPDNSPSEPMTDGRIWTQAERVGFYRALRLKYERAARYPWLPVESDPPTPQIIPPI